MVHCTLPAALNQPVWESSCCCISGYSDSQAVAPALVGLVECHPSSLKQLPEDVTLYNVSPMAISGLVQPVPALPAVVPSLVSGCTGGTLHSSSGPESASLGVQLPLRQWLLRFAGCGSRTGGPCGVPSQQLGAAPGGCVSDGPG